MTEPNKPHEPMSTQEQLNLGRSHYEEGKITEAIKVWSNITRDDSPEVYAQAQCNLGKTYYYSAGRLQKAIDAWSKVRQKDHPEAYAQAQLNLGDVYKDNGNHEKAIDAWSKVLQKDNPEAYKKAQSSLRDVYKDKKDFKIIKCPDKVNEDLNRLNNIITSILRRLQIIPKFEPKVAHYSRSSTAFSLLKKDQPSSFRLSTIRGVNDPTEGTVLGNYFRKQNIYENIHTNNIAAFISCFTFNHDSLNQFRLYGKENGREATGISLVFKKGFFDDKYSPPEFTPHPSSTSSCPAEKSGKPSNSENHQDKPKLEKANLYRCIYLDPDTGYLTLSHRGESTFYLQHKEDEFTAKNQWDQYYKEISEIEGYIKNNLSYIKNTLETILAEKYPPIQKEEILEKVRSYLLPLQYLVKHIAFQEEQECRIMYITQFRDEKIHSDREKQWMYVEYEEPVLPHIDKIWLSPGAAKDQDFFRILLDQGSGKSKVRISQNPFRNKE